MTDLHPKAQRDLRRPGASLAMVAALALGWNPLAAGAATAAATDDKPAVAAEVKEAPESLADLLAIEAKVQAAIARNKDAVVGLRVGPAQGSGVIVDEKGLVYTAGHVVAEPNAKVTFLLADGRVAHGVTLGMNTDLDSGLMRITDAGTWPHAEVGRSEAVKVGAWCVALGHPGGYQADRTPVARLGRVLANRDGYLMTDCTLIGGDSGGPLFDLDGKLIAIHSRIGQTFSQNFHVPVDTYRDNRERLLAGEVWGKDVRPVIGVVGRPGGGDGCLVEDLDPSKPAAKAGVRIGDVITRIDDAEIDSLADLVAEVKKHKPGDVLKIVLTRDDVVHRLEVEVAAHSQFTPERRQKRRGQRGR